MNKCNKCGKTLKTDKETYLYFDTNNIAITKSMSKIYFCKECLENYYKKGNKKWIVFK